MNTSRLCAAMLTCGLVGGGACGGSDAEMPDAGDPARPDAFVPQWTFEGVHGVANLDDDDGMTTDWEQPRFAADNDFSSLMLPASTLAMVPAGGTVELSLAGDVSALRVYFGGAHVLGAQRETTASHVFTPSGSDEKLEIEFGDYLANGKLTIAARDTAGTVVHTTDVLLQAAPLIMNHHLQPAEQVWIVSAGGNASMIDAFQQALGAKLTVIPGDTVDHDVWVQDEFEFATMIGESGLRIDVTIDSIRDRGLQSYSPTWDRPDSFTQTWGNPSSATTYDSFGNLEASPPVTVNGVSYPFGRIYYGRTATSGLNSTLGAFLASQKVQAPFQLPTNWLCVGHVDEFSTFVPAPGTAKGFKLAIADTTAAWTVIEGLTPSATLPKYGADHGYPTVQSLLDDAALRALNDAIQTDYLDPILATFKAELGLTDDDIIRLPALFEQISRCGGRVAALIPGMVNLTIAKVDGTTTHLFTADPFFRSTADQNNDPIIDAFRSRMPAGMELHFVDDWDTYHLGLGEVHCGTNAKRTPTETWWTTAEHLMGGS